MRELRELRRQGMDILTASIRDPDRSFELLTADEQEEATNTFYVKRQGAAGAARAGARALAGNPGRFFTGLRWALRIAGWDLAKLGRCLGYFGEALILGSWMRETGLKHLHVQYSSTVGLLLVKTFPVEISVSFHGPDEFIDPEGFRLRDKIEASVFSRAISSYSKSQLMKSCDYTQWSKIEAVYLGVDPERFVPRPFRPAPEPFEILCVGRLSPVKAQHVLVTAVGLLRQRGRKVLLRIVGGGPDRASLETYVRKLGLEEAVIVHGFTPQHELDRMYSHTDLFALASFAEGVPGVLMEAMAMEIPCVATNITGTPELIEHGVDGLLVPPSDVEALADAMDLLVTNPALRERIGKAGRVKIENKFHLEKNATTLRAVFERYLREPPAASTSR